VLPNLCIALVPVQIYTIFTTANQKASSKTVVNKTKPVSLYPLFSIPDPAASHGDDRHFISLHAQDPHDAITLSSELQTLNPIRETRTLNPIRYTLYPKPYTLSTRLLHPDPWIVDHKLYTLYPTPYTLHPILYTLNSIPYTLYSIPYTLHPTPYTLYPIPYTLHPIPYTLYPIPYILHPIP